ncbi:hypothetical protein JOE25_005392 [Serratia sp. PL17]|uniref:hypothetical protein n=1 Tax=Serratia sp. PL17 TaxID=2806582 RepID=UPI001AE1063A|nr:hypothetical protein [Serratia sp. PL17]MBP1133764.1 hypothetical protein [Serratia sp. PL17]
MKKISALVVMFILSGCSTTANELRLTTPAIEGHTNKNANSYIGCVLNNWNEKNTISPISPQPTEHGYSAQINDMARGVVMLIDVKNTDSGSDYVFYKKRDMSFYESAITSCK